MKNKDLNKDNKNIKDKLNINTLVYSIMSAIKRGEEFLIINKEKVSKKDTLDIKNIISKLKSYQVSELDNDVILEINNFFNYLKDLEINILDNNKHIETKKIHSEISDLINSLNKDLEYKPNTDIIFNNKISNKFWLNSLKNSELLKLDIWKLHKLQKVDLYKKELFKLNKKLSLIKLFKNFKTSKVKEILKERKEINIKKEFLQKNIKLLNLEIRWKKVSYSMLSKKKKYSIDVFIWIIRLIANITIYLLLTYSILYLITIILNNMSIINININTDIFIVIVLLTLFALIFRFIKWIFSLAVGVIVYILIAFFVFLNI